MKYHVAVYDQPFPRHLGRVIRRNPQPECHGVPYPVLHLWCRYLVEDLVERFGAH